MDIIMSEIKRWMDGLQTHEKNVRVTWLLVNYRGLCVQDDKSLSRSYDFRHPA